MGDLENKLREFEAELASSKKKLNESLSSQITPLLPIAVLFCNSEGQMRAESEHIKAIFSGSASIKFNALRGSVKGLEFVNHLAEILNSDKKVNDALIILNANENGFDMLRLMNFFEHQFFITDISQIALIGRISESMEYKIDSQVYGRQLEDSLWQSYDTIREDLIAIGHTPDIFSRQLEAIDKLKGKDSLLNQSFQQLIDALRHN